MRRVLLPPLVLLLVSATVLSACGRALAEPPAGSRPVTIDTPDGEQLDAIEMGSGPDVAIMSHGDTGTKEGFYRLVEPLAADGWRVIDYDARGVGNSTGGPRRRPGHRPACGRGLRP
jgi:pimeloyl-ACP methyl ester carboxylesterase